MSAAQEAIFLALRNLLPLSWLAAMFNDKKVESRGHFLAKLYGKIYGFDDRYNKRSSSCKLVISVLSVTATLSVESPKVTLRLRIIALYSYPLLIVPE